MKYNFMDIKKSIFEDVAIKDFCQKNNISDEIILNDFPKFLLQKDNNQICNRCKGDVCYMDPYGMQSKLIFNNRVDISYYKCPIIDEIDYANIDMLYFPNNDLLEKKELIFSKVRAEVLKKMTDFSSNFKKGQFNKGIYFHGPFGGGKTFLMMKLAKDLAKKNVKVMLAYYPDLVRFIKSSIATNELENIINRLKYVDVLMLDDVGAETNTSFIRDEVLGPILQFRLESYLTVCMTSNYDLNLLREHFMESKDEINKVKSDRLIERIKYLMHQVELNDKNYRQDKN